MKEFEINKNTITFNTGKKIEFDYPIIKDKVVVKNGIIVLLLDPPLDSCYVDNVVGVNIEGEFLWQIQSAAEFLNVPAVENDTDCYVSLADSIDNPYLTDEYRGDYIVAVSWSTNCFFVDIITGNIVYKFYTK